MSLSIADYSARIRDSLVDAKDSVLRIPPTLSETSLTIVMGSCQDSGKEDRAARISALKSNSNLEPFFSSLQDDDARKDAYSLLAVHIKEKVDARLLAVKEKAIVELVELAAVPIDTAQLCATQIDSIFVDMKALVLSSIKQDDAMTPQRRQAIEDFNTSIKVVKTTIISITKIEQNVSVVQQKLNDCFNSSDIIGTASDTTRAELSNLRKELQGQRSYQERQLLEHFNETARTRTSDVRITSVELIIPDSLVSKGRGLELIDNSPRAASKYFGNYIWPENQPQSGLATTSNSARIFGLDSRIQICCSRAFRPYQFHQAVSSAIDGFRSLGREREAQRAGGGHGPLRLTVPVTSVCGAALSVTCLFHCASPTAGTDKAHCGDWLLAVEEEGSAEEVQETDGVVEA